MSQPTIIGNAAAGYATKAFQTCTFPFSTTSLTVSLPTGLAAGDLLVAFPSAFGASEGDTFGSFPVTSGWTFRTVAYAGFSSPRVEVWTKVATSADVSAGNMTWSMGTFVSGTTSFGGFEMVVGVWALRGADVTVRRTYTNTGIGFGTIPIGALSGDGSQNKWLLTALTANYNIDFIQSVMASSNASVDSGAGFSIGFSFISQTHAHMDGVAGQITSPPCAGTFQLNLNTDSADRWVVAAINVGAANTCPQTARSWSFVIG